MSEYIRAPIVYTFGAIMGIIILIAAIVVLSGIGIVPSSTSTALVSTTTGYNQALPFIAILITGGIILGGLERRRR